MQAVVKTPRIEISVRGAAIPPRLMEVLKEEYGPELKTTMKKWILASLLFSAALMGAGSVYAAALYFPHVDTTNGWQTEIAIINTGAPQAVTGTLRALRNDGQLVEFKTVTLPALGRREMTVADEFTNHTGIGYLVFDTNSDTVQGYTKFYQEGQYRVAIPAVTEVNTSDIYVTHIDSGALWWTGLSLVNTTSETKNITITFNTGQTQSILLNANQHKAFSIASLFNDQPQPSIQSAVITHASGVIGLEVFATYDGKQMEGILLTDKTASTLYYPHVGSNGWWTGIVAYNPSDSASTITVTPYDVQGNPLATSTLPIAAKAKYVGTIATLGLPAQTAWFRIDSTIPLSGFELIGSNDFEQLAGYNGNGGTGAKAGVFAKIEKSGWTTIALVNTESSTASITLTAYTYDGTVVASTVLTIGSFAKIVNSAEGFFSPSISNAAYIAYSSDRNLVGLQLNGSADGTMLDGLPGLGVTGDGGNGGGGAVDICPDGSHCVSPFTCSSNSECQCPAGQQLCGHSCIPADASCCPDGSFCASPATCGSDTACMDDGSGVPSGPGVVAGMTYHMFANGCPGGVIYGYTGPNYTICNNYANSATLSLCSKVVDICH